MGEEEEMEGFLREVDERSGAEAGGVAEEIFGNIGETGEGSYDERGGVEDSRNSKNESRTRSSDSGEIRCRCQRRSGDRILAEGKRAAQFTNPKY